MWTSNLVWTGRERGEVTMSVMYQVLWFLLINWQCGLDLVQGFSNAQVWLFHESGLVHVSCIYRWINLDDVTKVGKDIYWEYLNQSNATMSEEHSRARFLDLIYIYFVICLLVAHLLWIIKNARRKTQPCSLWYCELPPGVVFPKRRVEAPRRAPSWG